MGRTHLNDVGQRSWLVLSILAKEDLEMLHHFFNMWCDKELPRMMAATCTVLLPLPPKLRPDMSGICYRLSNIPL